MINSRNKQRKLFLDAPPKFTLMAILILKDIDGHRMLWQIYLWSKYWSVRVKSVGEHSLTIS